MAKMTLVHGDDWSGVYVDGDLCSQGHHIHVATGVEIAIEKGVTEIETRLCDIDWLNDQGEFPAKMTAVKWLRS